MILIYSDFQRIKKRFNQRPQIRKSTLQRYLNILVNTGDCERKIVV
jgi:hypothetical protein